MRSAPLPRTRKLTVIAQDPSIVGTDGQILTTELEIPAEDLSPGPRGYRVHVVDYDSSTDTLWAPMRYEDPVDGCYVDPFSDYVVRSRTNDLLLEPAFHAQNVYAIVMRTLARFEFALGRRVGWGFDGHQLYVAPHAFADANAFYSEEDQALAFGYFFVPGGEAKQPIFTCLSYDVVAHETTHAILDGLRERYTAPSSAEQAGFHEGFADIVSLLSVFSLKDVVRTILLHFRPANVPHLEINEHKIPTASINRDNLEGSLLFGLAEQMGSALTGIRGSALRRSIEIKPLNPTSKPVPIPYLERREFREPHRCGEVLVAAILEAFLDVWLVRLNRYIQSDEKITEIDVSIAVEEGAEAAEHLLNIAIRGLDYMPPTDIRFSDYLSAILTCDREMVPDDSKYSYRKKLRDSFAAYGIKPADKADKDGYWRMEDDGFCYDRTHFDSMLRDPNEIFRFIWDNRFKLGLEAVQDYFGKAYLKVQSVRPCIRIGPDGFTIRETVAEYVQMVTLRFEELIDVGISGVSAEIPPEQEITLYGSGTLIFDEYGQLKYHVKNNIFSQRNQAPRIKYLWESGYYTNPAFTKNLFSRMHLGRALSVNVDNTEAF
jgi:hypothetical protein